MITERSKRIEIKALSRDVNFNREFHAVLTLRGWKVCALAREVKNHNKSNIQRVDSVLRAKSSFRAGGGFCVQRRAVNPLRGQS